MNNSSTPTSTFRYERRPVWSSNLNGWQDDLVAIDDQADALVWLHVRRSGIHECHVLTKGVFAWFCLRGEPVWIEPADRPAQSSGPDEDWELGVVPMLIWDPAIGPCPITPDKLAMRDGRFHGMMQAADGKTAEFVYAIASPALEWWPEAYPAAGVIPPRPQPRRLRRATTRQSQ
jgi:hypothetical protein